MVENSYQITCGLFSQKFVLEKVSKKLTATPPPPQKKKKERKKTTLTWFLFKISET